MTGKDEEAKKDLRKEDEINAHINEGKHRPAHLIDAIKTGQSKKDKTFDKPFDEQMYDSFEDIREQDETDLDSNLGHSNID